MANEVLQTDDQGLTSLNVNRLQCLSIVLPAVFVAANATANPPEQPTKTPEPPVQVEPATAQPAKTEVPPEPAKTEEPPKEEEPPPNPAIEVPRLLRSASQGATTDQILDKLIELEPRRAVIAEIATTIRHHDERVRVATIEVLSTFKVGSARQKIALALGDGSPAVVSAAARALHRLGGKGASFEVRSLLKHRSVAVRCTAADLVRKQSGKKKLVALEAQLKRATLPEERACVLRALHRGGSRGVMKRALPLIENHDTRALGVRVMKLAPEDARKELSKVLAGKPSEEFVAGSLEVAGTHGDRGMVWTAGLIRSKQAHVRRAALDMLLSRSKNKVVRGLLIDAAAKADAQTRVRVIDAMSEQSAATLLPLVRGWLGDRSPLVRAASARVMAKAGQKSDAARVFRAYQDERMRASKSNLMVRVALLQAMAHIANPDWVPLLVEASGQKGEEQAATDGLVAIGEPAVRTLLLVVKVGDMERIPFALEALARIGKGVGEAAEGLFRHPRELVRELGRDLLAASGDPVAVDALLTLFRSETLEDPVPVIQAIATFGTASARAGLVEAAEHPNEAVRVAAIKGLGESHKRSSDVVKAVWRVAETDKAPHVREAAVRSLFQLSAPGLPKLLRKLVQFEVPLVRTACHEALGWLGDPSAVPFLANRIRDAEGAEKAALNDALRRLTRRTDLKSARNYRDWADATKASLTGRAQKKPGKLKVPKGTLHFSETGSGSTVLVLGGGHRADMFAPAMDLLGGSRRIVYLNGRGRGESAAASKPSLKSELSDLEHARRGLKAGKVSIVAFGAEGLTALMYAKTYPKHVSRIVLVSTPPRGVRHGAQNVAARRLKGADALDLARLDARHAWFAPSAWLSYRHTALAPGLAGRATDGPRIAAYAPNPIGLQAVEKAAAGLDLSRLAGSVKVPINMVVGEYAALTGGQRARLQRAARKHAHVALRPLKGAGHYPHLESPDRFAALVRGLVGGR
ncbi:MAG: pimeloyl-ACP methyl ester carboxylesterase/HEAT repeat protein [Myxococcota bacterium]